MNRSWITKAQVEYCSFLYKVKCEFSFIDFDQETVSSCFNKFLVNVSANDRHHYNISTFIILIVTFCLFERQITRNKGRLEGII